jgi:uncharacterized membrane protein YkoI
MIALALGLATPIIMPAAAGIENEVQRLVEIGAIMPFETIRNRVVSQVKGDYVGAEFDSATLTYRFRFLVDGRVINVDVDARTGKRARAANF